MNMSILLLEPNGFDGFYVFNGILLWLILYLTNVKKLLEHLAY